jgi:carboxyl-terminal processing protease
MSGDKIRFINEKETKDIALDAAVQIIRGPKGSKVTLTISREGEEEDLKISIIRNTIRIPNLKWEMKEDGIAYISLFHFTDTASGDFERISDEILKSDARSIILDLRNNPGGFLEVAVDIAGWFLQNESVVVTEDHNGRGENRVYTSRGSGALGGYPAVVLVNGGSASAAEILAGALRDQRGVLLIGEKTFGKGSVQELTSLSDRSNIKITVAKWITPNGISLEGNGLDPDIKVEMTEEIIKKDGDIQLKKAIETIQGL